ncbi:MAG: glycosyltransferase family 2 protein, partial [Rhizobiales bacterium]|nr:glycosyltransferase family 2 protein [Hyphomicrobiales bacterium]
RQTFPDWELVLIDDGSRDDGATRAAKFGDPRIRIVRHPESRGLACRLNEAVELSRGKFIARMDADDICYPERLAAQTELLLSDSRLDLVASKALAFRSQGEPLGLYPTPVTHTDIAADPISGFKFPHPTWCGKAEWFRKHRYDERMTRAQDQELLLRAAATSHFSAVDKILLGYRQEGLKLSNSMKGRLLFAAATWRDARRSGHYAQAAKHSLLNLLKFGAEAAAIALGAGAEEFLIKRRYLRLSAEDIAQWRSVWNEMTGP